MRRSLFAFMLLGLAFTVQAKISRVEQYYRFCGLSVRPVVK